DLDTCNQKQVGLDHDIVDQVKNSTHQSYFCKHTDTTDHKSDVTNNQIGEETTNIGLNDGSKRTYDNGKYCHDHQQVFGKIIRYKDEAEHPNHGINPHLGQ